MLKATYSTPKTAIPGGVFFCGVLLCLALDCVGIVRSLTLLSSVGHANADRLGLAGFLSLIVLSLFALTGVIARRCILCFTRSRLVVHVYHAGLVLIEGSVGGRKTSTVIHWEQVAKVQSELEKRETRTPGYKRYVPFTYQVIHCTLHLKNGAQFRVRDDVQGIEHLVHTIESAVARCRDK